jgi:hypothetical protein
MFTNGGDLGIGHTVGMRSLGHTRTRRTWPGIGFAVLIGTGKMHFVEVDIRSLSEGVIFVSGCYQWDGAVYGAGVDLPTCWI